MQEITTDGSSSDDGQAGQSVAVIHDRLRRAILDGDLAPGETTSQAALARELGFGRTPLREALRLLEREGLVVSEPGRKVRVSELSLVDLEGVYAMRIALEAVGIRATIPRLREEDFAELEGFMAQMDHYIRRGDSLRMSGPHADFHERFVAHAGPRVTGALAQLFDHANRYRVAYNATLPAGYDDRRAEHRAIFDAAASGDAELTVQRLVEHYARTAMTVITGIDNCYRPAVLLAAIDAACPAAAV